MELVSPGLGLIFWMTLCFSIVLFILTKFAWKPILKMIKDREESITVALNSAEEAKKEMLQLKVTNEQILKEAKDEKALILKEARMIKDSIIEEAEKKATEKYNIIVESAMQEIHNRKQEAITDLKNQLAILSIDIAEKLLKEELSNTVKQKDVLDKLLKEINFN